MKISKLDSLLNNLFFFCTVISMMITHNQAIPISVINTVSTAIHKRFKFVCFAWMCNLLLWLCFDIQMSSCLCHTSEAPIKTCATECLFGNVGWVSLCTYLVLQQHDPIPQTSPSPVEEFLSKSTTRAVCRPHIKARCALHAQPCVKQYKEMFPLPFFSDISSFGIV